MERIIGEPVDHEKRRSFMTEHQSGEVLAMRKIIFILAPAVLITSATIALAQASGGAGVGSAGAGGHAGGALSGHPASVTSNSVGTGLSGKSGTGAANGTVSQPPTQPGCAGAAAPAISTTPNGLKPAC
jgi:hypothetical protein